MGGLLLATWLVSGVLAPASACDTFLEEFRSAPIPARELPSIEEFRGPWPKSTRPVEAGFDPACRVGDRAAVVAMCPSARTHLIVPRAPVIATDPEGFTVVMVSRQDHEQLAAWGDELLYYARCRPAGGAK